MAEVSTEEKLALLKKAYRTLKSEAERRDEAIGAERASHARERSVLSARVEELTHELDELKRAVRSAGAEARERLHALEAGAPGAASAQAPVPAADSVVLKCAAAEGPSAMSSYRRGMDWANHVLNARDAFTTALSTSFKSVSDLAVPQSVQQQMAHQLSVIDSLSQARARCRCC